MGSSSMKSMVAMTAVASASVLTACGGAGGPLGEVVKDFGQVLVAASGDGAATLAAAEARLAGSVLRVEGTATTNSTLLKKVEWTVSAVGGPSPTLTNENCLNVKKTDRVVDKSLKSPATGASNWTCGVSVTVPENIRSDAQYILTFTATDERGTTSSATRMVKFAPQEAYKPRVLAVNVGDPVRTVRPKSVNDLVCAATGGTEPYRFRWIAQAGDGDGVRLSSLTDAKTQYTASATAASQSVLCEVTDAAGAVVNSMVGFNISSEPRGTMPVDAGGTFSVQAGTTAFLRCAADQAVGAVSYRWRQVAPQGDYIRYRLNANEQQLVSFSAPSSEKPDVAIFECQATDEAGRVGTALTTVNIAPNVQPLTAFAGPPLSLTPGQVTALNCSSSGGVGPYTFEWLVKDSGGLNLTLSAFDRRSVNLTAPVVSVATPVDVACRVTDSRGIAQESSRLITMGPATDLSLVAQIAPVNRYAAPGDIVTLDSTGSGWFNAQGQSANGPTITYNWTSLSANAQILSGQSARSTSVRVTPNGTDAVTLVPVRLTLTSGDKTSTSDINLVVDAEGLFDIKFSGAAGCNFGPGGALNCVVEQSNGVFNVKADVTVNGRASTRILYYRWAQISGPKTLELGASRTNLVGFETKVPGGPYVLRLEVDTRPLEPGVPARYSEDVHVYVSPPPAP